ncbi:bile acid:sodium symporter family protein [Hyphobacterium marinum]|uniref:Bile acid:sodium symporter n=1 Tax=Hyphobacterium marinum TaxID=3116574 RepID=A0ABU7LYY4_9PROT|nr:bile acid:sodium symporter [Hyphobacterium sp. Y6023]MEE2566768.1 bile acid:sodium symporter [Hyphobacterium sp. Y6023]
MTDPAALDASLVSINSETQIALSVVLAMMMFAVALSLKPSDFAFLKTRPVMFAGGALTQILGLPLLSLGLAALIAPTPSVALGMIVVACCPGGNISNIFVMAARGNTAYSVSLTALSSALAFLVTPVSILFWASLYPPTAALIGRIELEAGPFIIQVALLMAVPLAIGMTVSGVWPRFAARIQPLFYTASLVAIFVLVVLGLYGNWALLIGTGLIVLPVAIAHNAAAFGLGAVSGRVLRLDIPSRRALTFEIGIQNSGLGLVILLSQFQGLGGAAAVTAIWAVWHLIAGSTLASAFRLIDRRGDRA